MHASSIDIRTRFVVIGLSTIASTGCSLDGHWRAAQSSGPVRSEQIEWLSIQRDRVTATYRRGAESTTREGVIQSQLTGGGRLDIPGDSPPYALRRGWAGDLTLQRNVGSQDEEILFVRKNFNDP